ncbi:MAG: hypothetical protein QXG69_00425 [Candidatus Caldarchaeum sp.]
MSRKDEEIKLWLADIPHNVNIEKDENEWRLQFLTSFPAVVKDRVRLENFRVYAVKTSEGLSVGLEPDGKTLSRLPRQFIPPSLMSDINKHSVKPPSPQEAYDGVWSVFAKYLDVDDETITLFTVYTIYTYFHFCFHTAPYLYLWGARQSGKTKTLSLFEKMCFHAVATVNTSPSAIFRLAGDFGITLILDESEYLRNGEGKNEIQYLLNAGYKRDTSSVLRVEGDRKKEVKVFNVFGPKVMASINYPYDVLLDRCIIVNMRRGSNTAKLNLEPVENFEIIRENLFRLMLYHFDEVYSYGLREFDHPLLIARELELWRPLFAVGSWLADSMGSSEVIPALTKILENNVKIKQSLQVDSDLNTVLYKLAAKVQSSGSVSARVIREWILDDYRLDSEEFRTMQKLWTTQKVARILSTLGFQHQRVAGETKYHLDPSEIRRLCQAYGVAVEN